MCLVLLAYSALARIIIFLCVNFRAWGQNFFATTDRPTDRQLERVIASFFLVIFRHFLVILWSFYDHFMSFFADHFLPSGRQVFKLQMYSPEGQAQEGKGPNTKLLFRVKVRTPNCCSNCRYERWWHSLLETRDCTLFLAAPEPQHTTRKRGYRTLWIGASADIVLLKPLPLETFTPKRVRSTRILYRLIRYKNEHCDERS